MGQESGYQVSGNSAELFEQVTGVFLLKWADDLVDAAKVAPGERVLDLACGTGFVARRAAARVGPSGVVEGLDVNPTMADQARRATGLTIHEAAADATGLADASFDVVLCQQGLQYFPDGVAALAETRRLLTGRGRVGFSVWAELEHNPFTEARVAALEQHLDPDEVAAFRNTNIATLGGVDGMAGLFSEAGFVDVSINRHDLVIELPPMETYFPSLIAATPWAATYAGLDEDQQAAVVDHMRRALEPTPNGDGSLAPMASYVTTASTPA